MDFFTDRRTGAKAAFSVILVGSCFGLDGSAKIEVEEIRDVLAGKSEFVAVTFGAAFSLSPGKYQCRMVIRNLETGRGAVASATAVITN